MFWFERPEQAVAADPHVVSAGQALIKIGGAEGRAVVDLALSHALTNPAAKAKLQAIAEASDVQKQAAPAAVSPAPKVKGP